jgi:glycosyltransferase involved in cell wall biosynthesis
MAVFCSTIIPTIGRPSLQRAVNSVLDQTLTSVDFEVIIVNDTGQPLLDFGFLPSERVRFIHTQQREKCFARNTGAAIARGKYLHFLDDDDWILPNALETFWELTQRNEKDKVFYGGVKLVDTTGNCLGELNLSRSGNCYTQLVAGSLILSLGLLVETEAFFSVGGFNSKFRVTEDTDLWRRLAYRYNFVNTSVNVACALKGEGWNTSANYTDAVENNRLSRDMALSVAGAFGRLRNSASTGYWQGRIVQAYLASTRWNIQKKQPFTAISRFIFGMLGFVLAGRNVFSVDFWRAMRDTQVPYTQDRVLGR